MGRTACTEPQCLYSRAKSLLPLWAVRPVQSLSACTIHLYLYSPYGPYGLYRASEPVQYSYTSTPPMGRTACTDSQCLYSTAIPLLPLWAVGLYRASVPVQGCTLANCRTPITSNEKVRCTQVFVYSARKIDNLTTGLRGEVVIALEDGTDTLFRNVGKE